MAPPPPTWQPYREPVYTTLVRTLLIAAAVGAVFSVSTGRVSRWPIATLLALWPALGGHFVELLFLNVLRPRLSRARAEQVIARLTLWFAAGVAMLYAIRATAHLLNGNSTALLRPTAWWLGGVGFIAVELIAHAVLRLRGRPSFYEGRG